MRGVGIVVMVVALCAAPAWAFTCPVLIQQAEEMLKKAESGRVTGETRPLLDEARKQLNEARTQHEKAKSKRDHADAVRKARVSMAFIEEALALQQ